MAHKKAGGSSNNGRDSAGRRLGIKKFGGETGDDPGWNTGEIDIYYNREIAEIHGDQRKIVLDAPIYDHLDAVLAQAYLYRWDSSGLIRNSGVEDLK